MAVTAAAVSVPAFVILGPWALVALVLATTLVLRRPSRSVLVASLIMAALSTALGFLLMTGSSADFQPGITVLTLTSASAAAVSALALRRLSRA